MHDTIPSVFFSTGRSHSIRSEADVSWTIRGGGRHAWKREETSRGYMLCRGLQWSVMSHRARDAEPMLGYCCRRRWLNINPALGQRESLTDPCWTFWKWRGPFKKNTLLSFTYLEIRSARSTKMAWFPNIHKCKIWNESWGGKSWIAQPSGTSIPEGW